VAASSWVLPFLRRFLIACVVVGVIAALGVAVGDAGIKEQFDATPKVKLPSLVKADPGKPANFLDPKTRMGMLVSFPRDLVVSIPGHESRALINAAYDEGGPDLVIQTLQANFPPLHINHYIEVNFKGFQDIVNAIGRVSLWFPTPAHDSFSDLNQPKAGCISVDGAGALAYARSRYYSVPRNVANPAPWQPNSSGESPGWITDPRSDLDRIPRQQYFLRTISQAAIDKTSANPIKLFGLLDAVQGSFKADDQLKLSELKALIRTFKNLDPKRVEMLTLPVTQAPYPGWQAHVVATDQATDVVKRLMYFGESSSTPIDALPPAKVNVRIVNGTPTPGAAQPVVAEFVRAGYHVVGPAQDADRTDYAFTQVRYAPGEEQSGFTVALGLKTLNLLPAIDRRNTLNADVLVIVGKDYNTLQRTLGPASTVAGGSVPTTTTTVAAPTTTTTTVTPPSTADPRFVPADPKTGGPLVGCP
jgi:LCP family protein required for cell wall assembly